MMLLRGRGALLARRYMRDHSRTASVLSHVSADGKLPTMVDVSGKAVTTRTATARSLVVLPSDVAALITAKSGGNSEPHGNRSKDIQAPKGPVFATAIVAGVQAVKRTSELIPFCHPLPVEGVKIKIGVRDNNINDTDDDTRKQQEKPVVPKGGAVVEVECSVKVTHKTGVEMEALTGASVAALCIYDMLKAVSHDIVVHDTRLMSKTGGKRHFERRGNEEDDVMRPGGQGHGGEAPLPPPLQSSSSGKAPKAGASVGKETSATGLVVRNHDSPLDREAYEALPKAPVHLVLDNVRSAFNVGSIFRCADNARIQEIVTAGITAHPPNKKLAKTALGTESVVSTRHFDSTKEAVESLQRRGIRVLALETTSESVPYLDVDFVDVAPGAGTALVLGNEYDGISPEVIAACDGVVEIPMQGYKNSLNVACAASIVCFEAVRQLARDR